MTQTDRAQAAAGLFTIEVDGRALPARPGQTVAAVMMAAGQLIVRRTASGAPRGVFCGMGVCFDCIVTIDGMPEQRACMTPAQPGMRVDTGLEGVHPSANAS